MTRAGNYCNVVELLHDLRAAGAAEAIANLLVKGGRALGGGAAIQVAVYIATVLLSNVVANNASAALMYPIAINVAITEGMRTDLMAYLLMLAASASFAVPFAYQTNLMVYGAGGYKALDFLRFGGPMQVRLCSISCKESDFASVLVLCCMSISRSALGMSSGLTH